MSANIPSELLTRSGACLAQQQFFEPSSRILPLVRKDDSTLFLELRLVDLAFREPLLQNLKRGRPVTQARLQADMLPQRRVA
jgi:hypothetical protein